MAAINRSVAVNVVGRIAEFQTELKKLPGVTDAEAKRAALKLVTQFSKAEAQAALAAEKAALRSINRVEQGANNAQKKVSETGKRAVGEAMRAGQSVAVQIPDVITQLAAGTDASIVAMQQGLQIVQVNMDLVLRGLGKIAAALPPIAIAAAAAATAYAVYQNAAERVEEANGRLNQRLEDAVTAFDNARIAAARHARVFADLDKGVQQTEQDIDVLLGVMSEEEAAHNNIRKAINAKAHDGIRDSSLLVQQAERERQVLNEHLAQARLDLDEREAINAKLLQNEKKLTDARVQLNDRKLQRERAINIAIEKDAIERDQKLTEEQQKAFEKQEEQRKSNAEKAAAEQKANDDKAKAERERAIAELGQIEAEQAQFSASALEKVNLAYDQKRDRINEIAQILKDEEQVAAIRDQNEIDRLTALQKVTDEFHEKRLRQTEEEAAKRLQTQQRTDAAIRSATQALMSATSQAFMMSAQNQAKTNREGALASFRVAKGLNIAEAIMSTQSGAARALRDHPFPASTVIAGLVAATGAVRIGMIAAQQPSFDVGGIAGGGIVGAPMPDQQPARLLAGEAVLNRTAVASIGAEGVRSLNSGQGAAPSVVVVDSYRHFDRFMGDEIGRGGRLTRALDGKRNYPIGQRGF